MGKTREVVVVFGLAHADTRISSKRGGTDGCMSREGGISLGICIHGVLLHSPRSIVSPQTLVAHLIPHAGTVRRRCTPPPGCSPLSQW